MNLGAETETLEFKKTTGELKEAVQSICAILNKHQHGDLYFGVKPDGTPLGQIVTEESLREVSQKIKNFIEPKIYPSINKVVIDGKECIHVKFEGNQVPYFAYGVARIRVADEDLAMSPEQITELLLKIAISYTDKKTVLNQLELVVGDSLLNAGKALFSDDIVQDVQMAIFATKERLTFNDIQRHHGPVLKLVDIAENYIRSNIHWRVEFTGELQRTEIPEIPVDAIREALLNSFCHKDYASGQSNEVTIYKDRVEIYNPGAFPEGYDPQDFINNAERAIRRNPKIARILYYSKDIESFGTGLKRIADACDTAGVRYEFRKLKSGFVVCFYRTIDSNADEGIKEKSTGKVREKYGKSTEIINASQKKIINYLQENEQITNKDVQKLLGVRESRALKILKSLVESGILEKRGKSRSSFYILK